MFKVKAPVLAGHWIVIVALAALHYTEYFLKRCLQTSLEFYFVAFRFSLLKKKENVRIRYSCMYVYTICLLKV